MKLILIIGLIISFILWKPLFIVLFPGTLLFFTNKVKADLFLEQLFYTVIFSLAFWIVGFSLLKFIPLHFSTFIDGTLYVSLILSCLSIFLQKIRFIKLIKTDLFWLTIFVIFSALFLRMYFDQIVPAGADMATHTYTARVINYWNSYPKTHEPIVPINTFGFAPYGLSVITAAISYLTKLPIHRSSLLVVVFTYPLLAVSFFLLLRNYFSNLVIFALLFFLFVSEKHLISFIYGGTIQTILSLSFLIFGIRLYLDSFKQKNQSIRYYLVIPILLAASFYTHQTPLMVLLFFSSFWIIYLVLVKRFNEIKYVLFSSAILFVLSLPFLTSIQNLTTTELEHIYEWQHRKQVFYLAPNIFLSLSTAIQNLIKWHSLTLFILMLFGMNFSIFLNKKAIMWVFAAVWFMFILLINANYWILPLSPLFYPDRVLTIGLIPISYFIALSFFFIEEMIKKMIRFTKLTIFGLIIISPIVIIGLYDATNKFFNNKVLKVTRYFSSVTQEDMNVMNWIRDNTSWRDVVANNYGDAGVWIPAIIGRKITVNDCNAHYISDLRSQEAKLVPSLLFIGSKQVYPDPQYKDYQVKNNPMYKLIYQYGDSKLYRIVYKQ